MMLLLRQPRPGLTLAELVVVLLILAITASIAIVSMESVIDQGRFDASQRTLQSIEEAILGPSNQRDADGTLLISGFVADTGRLPVAVGTDPHTQLAELWSNPNGLATFALKKAGPDGDPWQRDQLLIPCGWRGPYMRLPVGAMDLRDGWGNPYEPLLPPTAPFLVLGARSWGADNTSDSNGGGLTGYDKDMEIGILPLRFQSPLTGEVRLLDASGNAISPGSTINNISVIVRFFGPDPNTGNVQETTTPFLQAQNGNSIPYSFPNATVGPRAVRVYLVDADNNSNIVQMGQVVRLTLVPGGQTKTLSIHVPQGRISTP